MNEKEKYINEMLDKFCNDWNVSYLSVVEVAQILKEKIKDR